ITSSSIPLQFSSMPLPVISVASGLIAALLSSQSSLFVTNPVVASQSCTGAPAPKPSPSLSAKYSVDAATATMISVRDEFMQSPLPLRMNFGRALDVAVPVEAVQLTDDEGETLYRYVCAVKGVWSYFIVF